MREWLLHRFRRRPSDEEFAAEVQAHLAHETDEQIERGLPPEEARYVALRRFGNVTRHRGSVAIRTSWESRLRFRELHTSSSASFHAWSGPEPRNSPPSTPRLASFCRRSRVASVDISRTDQGPASSSSSAGSATA